MCSPDTAGIGEPNVRETSAAQGYTIEGFAEFRDKVLRLTGIDLACYKPRQMERRLRAYLDRVGSPTLKEYAHVLETSPEDLKKFRDFITINVSEFFRTPEKFAELESSILPDLLRKRPRLRVWSAGCSNGAEPYSVAMILDSLTPGKGHYILATDVDATIVSRAMAGHYSGAELKNVSRERLARYFRKVGDTYYLSDTIKSKVTFKVHNLLSDPFEEDFDLILCRNVVIYFTDEAKNKLYRGFHRSLAPHGVLFVGGTESILNARELGFINFSPFFYRKA